MRRGSCRRSTLTRLVNLGLRRCAEAAAGFDTCTKDREARARKESNRSSRRCIAAPYSRALGVGRQVLRQAHHDVQTEARAKVEVALYLLSGEA